MGKYKNETPINHQIIVKMSDNKRFYISEKNTEMVLGNTNTLMEIVMKENGKMGNLMVKGIILPVMVIL